ncbi:DUF6507 family protein [Streptomyces sp. NPDC001262]|uniref:DUF6507 family protein n=1 Tax=Streptomyces sp. NPDC001262 TaxID=3364552 RepID=UPI00367500D8
MPGWDIKPDAVRVVLGTTRDKAEKLGEELQAYATTMESAAKSAGTMIQGEAPKDGAFGPVAGALGEFGKNTQDDLKFLMVRSAKSIRGAAEATQCYEAGDLKMAQDTQNAAAQAPTPKELKGEAKK